ncbi:hypothetical protein B7486_47565 [cyanobacterium TDX16]|nr:hypothetical protein B7486_47565 [cyanobacterium TDX16]
MLSQDKEEIASMPKEEFDARIEQIAQTLANLQDVYIKAEAKMVEEEAVEIPEYLRELNSQANRFQISQIETKLQKCVEANTRLDAIARYGEAIPTSIDSIIKVEGRDLNGMILRLIERPGVRMKLVSDSAGDRSFELHVEKPEQVKLPALRLVMLELKALGLEPDLEIKRSYFENYLSEDYLMIKLNVRYTQAFERRIAG